MLLDELVVPMPSDTPNLLEIFEMIADNHEDTLTYTLENEAYTASEISITGWWRIN